jgi:hypothetical protein
MVEEKPENIEASEESARARRVPPTIDLEATEIPNEAPDTDSSAQSAPSAQPTSPGRISLLTISALSGACAAALVLGAAWLFDRGQNSTPAAPVAPTVSVATVNELTARVASLESRTSKPIAAVTDPAVAGRIDALEKSEAALRGDLADLQTKLAKPAAANEEPKPVAGEQALPEISEIKQRLAAIERTNNEQGAAIAQESAKPADDVALRRLVAAALLDLHARTGDAYVAALGAAKSLAPKPDALRPLENFASTGVPSPAVLCRELLSLVPKLSPPSPDNSAAASSLIDRLQAGAAKLVRIERTDAVGNERGNVVARVTAAALRNDYSEARRELNTLSSADRAVAQGWIEKADARDAALAASRQFAAEAMTALAKPAP